MFQFIRKHQAIGLIFIGIVIVSFVIFFSPNQRGGGRAMLSGSLGTIRGEPIGREEYLQARQEIELARLLRGENRAPLHDLEEQQQVLNRLFLLSEAERLGIRVADEVVAGRIVELSFLKDERTGSFSRAAYDQFLAGIGREPGISRAGFEQFIRHEIGLQQLVQIGGLSGTLVPPQEAAERYREAHQHYSVQFVTIASSNYLARTDLSVTNVMRYYSNHLAEYRIPERVQVRYVKFPGTNFLAVADEKVNSNSNLVESLDAEYQRRGPDSFRDAQGNVMPPEAAKAEMKEQLRKNLALDAAHKQAVEFANKLYRLEAKPDSLNQLARESGLTVHASLPFNQFSPPTDMQVPPTFTRSAFALSEEEPFATPVVGDDAVYVYAFDRRIPSEIQPFENVRNRVVESVRKTESRALAAKLGEEFAALARKDLASDKSFEAAASQASLKTLTVTNLSRLTTSIPGLPPQITVSEVLRTASDLQPGTVADYVPAADGGFVLFLESRTPPPEEEVKSALDDYLRQVRQTGRLAAFMEWQRKRFADADVRMPGFGRSATNATTAAP